ncbi:hypothetical protein ABE599_25225 [Achromobacter mucicolens]|uniref:hypothetical protein n=1 Tax=Achromobacter mucicolens TaxID=1389922 RepID=UPI0015820FE2|nr:hypothetical protein [Achromobacter mucicolens]
MPIKTGASLTLPPRLSRPSGLSRPSRPSGLSRLSCSACSACSPRRPNAVAQ